MTKEGLEKEAKQSYFDNTYEMQLCAEGDFDYTRGYLAGAEPREKRISELTDELTLTNNECKDMREELKQRIRENQKLCEQIEKMKNCGNCTKGNCVNIGRKGKACAYWTSNELREIKEK